MEGITMQSITGVLVFGALQLLFLIIYIYLIAFMQMYYKVRVSGADALLILLQLLNMILLPRYVIGYDGFFLAAAGSYNLLFAAQVAFISVLLFRLICLFQKALKYHRELLKPQSIRETIDFLPGGISFSTPDGRPILTNHRMNELIYKLTGHTMVNTRSAWVELQQLDSANGCVKLKDPWISLCYEGEISDESVFFLFTDGSIWMFRKEELTDQIPHSTQLAAADISDLYKYSKKLYQNNQRLAKQHERQQNILANIIQINREKEILSTKMRIHDDLGRSILTTKQYLSNHTIAANTPYLMEIWNNTIRNLVDFTRIYTDTEISPEIELQKAADMIGCHIDFRGDRPNDRKTGLLLYATVREALTNAVMHANASRLNVIIEPDPFGYHVEISDNGIIPVAGIVEGNGLGNLRKRLEQEGATLEIKCTDGVVLIVDLPAE